MIIEHGKYLKRQIVIFSKIKLDSQNLNDQFKIPTIRVFI